MNGLSLFSGSGLLDLAFEQAGGTTIGLCECDPFCNKLLQLRFPEIPLHLDVCTLKGGDIDEEIHVVYGGFPCQDLSQAGAQEGLAGQRSGLWFEMHRLIDEIRPYFCVAENVRGAINLALDTVYSNLEDIGYEVWPHLVPANAFGAPHERYRLIIVGVREDVADACRERLQGCEWLRDADEESPPTLGSATECCEAGGRSKELADARSTGPQRRRGQGDTEEGIHRVGTSAGCGEELGPNWPTLTVNGNNNRKGVSKKSGDGLATAVRNWPTLRTGGLCGGTRNYNAIRSVFDKDTTRGLTSNNGGQLQPGFCEVFMGAPLGWTDLECPNEDLQYLPFPMGMGVAQHPWEPPRLLPKGVKIPFKKERIKCLGNAIVIPQVIPFFHAVKYMYDLIR